MTDSERHEGSGKPPKKPYSNPRLREYGSVSRLTRGGGFVGNDGNTKCDTGQASANDDQCIVS